MAQKKVILKDGSNDLLPKTLASMVFTEAGQTVEEALQNAGGGSSSGGGTGNVNVTNASGLKKDAYYTFRPSAAGSLTGKFETIPYASGTVSGLMLPSDYNKLAAIRTTIDLPSGLKDLTAESTDEQVFDVFGEMLNSMGLNIPTDYPDNKIGVGYPGCLVFAMILSGNDIYDFQFALDKNPVSASFEVQAPDETSGQQYPIKGSASFTYVTSGRLRTVTLTATFNSSGDTATYDFTAKVEESGDDTYYLPYGVINISNPVTTESLQSVFGMTYGELAKAVNGKKVYIYDNFQSLLCPHIPVSVKINLGVYCNLSWVESTCIYKTLAYAPSSSFSKIHLDGYPLPMDILSLSSSSDTDTISTAVGGESGLKGIIQAVKDGNRLVIRGAYPQNEDLTVDLTVKSVAYIENENGDISLGISFDIYLFIGYTSNFIMVSYTKSSNTFTADSYSKSFG